MRKDPPSSPRDQKQTLTSHPFMTLLQGKEEGVKGWGGGNRRYFFDL